MHEGVVSHNAPSLKSSCNDDRKPCYCQIFGHYMGLMAQWQIPEEPRSYKQSQ